MVRLPQTSESVEGTLETRKDLLLSPNESLGLMRAGVNDDNHLAHSKFFLTYQHLERARFIYYASSAASPRPRQEDNNKQVSRWMTGRNKANALSVSFSEQKVVPITTKKNHQPIAEHIMQPCLNFFSWPFPITLMRELLSSITGGLYKQKDSRLRPVHWAPLE